MHRGRTSTASEQASPTRAPRAGVHLRAKDGRAQVVRCSAMRSEPLGGNLGEMQKGHTHARLQCTGYLAALFATPTSLRRHATRALLSPGHPARRVCGRLGKAPVFAAEHETTACLVAITPPLPDQESAAAGSHCRRQRLARAASKGSARKSWAGRWRSQAWG
jgi:hypothetical protein